MTEDRADRAIPARREPTLRDAGGPRWAVASGTPRPRDAQRNQQQVELNLSQLASAGFLDLDNPESEAANEFRRIKRPLIRACQGKLAAPVANANRIMVTSSVPKEGKSFVSLNLAFSMAMERDSTVLLIDADTTRRRLSRLMKIDAKPGLLDLLSGEAAEVTETLLSTNIERLTLLPAGGPRRHATELLASEAMEQLLQKLSSQYADRILIFDTPPLLAAPEPAVLATHMGQIVVVIEAEKTTQKIFTNALATIESCPLVTVVLNKTSAAQAGYYYYAAD
jgi:receptor protein-tyrosine kinase